MRQQLSVPEKHQLKIARRTLEMNDVFAAVMGGPTKEEAREIILRLTGRKAKGNHLCDVFGCESEWTCDRPGEQDFRYCVCAEHAGIDIEDFLCRLLNGRILARRRRACTGLAGRVAGAIFTEEEARAGGDGLVRGSSETQAN